MKDSKAFTVSARSGWKLVLVGRSDGKVFGTRMHIVPGQPRKPFATRDAAIDFARTKFGLFCEKVEAYGKDCGDGQFVSKARLKSLKPEAVGAGVSTETPVPHEWKDLPLANLFAAGIAAKSYIEKTTAIERLRTELDEVHSELARAIGVANADKLIAGIRADTP
jgi:hypothetical protein